MGLFKKKKSEEDEEVIPNLPTKKVAKKEPPKPWGKRERILVAGTFLFTVLSSAFLAMYARSWKLPNLPRIVLGDINFLSNEKIVLEADGQTQKSQALERSKKITTEFTEITNSASGVWGLYVYDIKNDFSFGVNQDEEFQAASLIKLPLIVMLYDLEAQGKVDFAAKHILTVTDKVGGAGSLYSQPVGTEISYEEIVFLMANQSDNTAFRIALNLVGEQEFKDYINTLGLYDTSYDDNFTTPADIGRLLKKLYSGDIVEKESVDKIMQSLTDTAFENHLPVGVADQVQVAHKYGREVHVVNDAGIVFATDPYVVVIVSKGVVENEADQKFPELSAAVYQPFSVKD